MASQFGHQQGSLPKILPIPGSKYTRKQTNRKIYMIHKLGV